MKILFWLLDLNYEVKNNIPELWLWGIDGSGKKVLVIDRFFADYFYVVVEDGFDPATVVKEIEKGHYSSVVKVEVAARKFFGKSVNAIKVYCKDPEAVAKNAKAFRKLEGVKDCLEDDIRYSMRYLIDNNIIPC